MKPIVLTKREAFTRPYMYDHRDMADRLLAQEALLDLRMMAVNEARRATEDGREWPEWVTVVMEYRAELMERRAVRRELREMAMES